MRSEVERVAVVRAVARGKVESMGYCLPTVVVAFVLGCLGALGLLLGVDWFEAICCHGD